MGSNPIRVTIYLNIKSYNKTFYFYDFMEDTMKKEQLQIVANILENEEFKKRKSFCHHGTISVYEHSIKVTILAYKIASKLRHVDLNSVVIGSLLHDFYFKDWQSYKEKRPLLKKHGFVHAKEALINSEKFFPELINEKTRNIILRHMFPLNKIPPKYKEAWIVSIADKIVSLETLLQPQSLIKILGL